MLALIAPVSALAVRRPIFLLGAAGADMSDENGSEYATFDRRGKEWLAIKSRRTYTILEFAELMANVDKTKLDLGDPVQEEFYWSKVTPHLRLIVDWLDAEEEGDDIPF